MDFKSLLSMCPDVPGEPESLPAQFPAGGGGKLTWKLGATSGGKQTALKPCAMSLSLLFCLACCRGPFQGLFSVVMLRSHCVWGALSVGQNAAVWEVLTRRVAEECVLNGFKWRSFAQKKHKGKQQWKIERLLQEVAPKKQLPELKQLCSRKKWLGLPVILAANSTSNLCTPEKNYFLNGGGERTH